MIFFEVFPFKTIVAHPAYANKIYFITSSRPIHVKAIHFPIRNHFHFFRIINININFIYALIALA